MLFTLYYPTCPECGETAEVTGEWVQAGAAGPVITGLDIENCPDCWDTMSKNGAQPGIYTSDGKGGYSFTAVARPSAAA